MSAGDFFGDVKRPAYLKIEKEDLGKLGIVAEELELRAYFGDPDKLAEKLPEYDLVWVTGGNSFVLRNAMQKCGFDDLIKTLLADDKLVYGVSISNFSRHLV